MKLRYLLIALVLLSFTSLFIGESDLSPLHLMSMTEQQLQILTISRFPRLISIIIAGAAMSISGLIMQQLSRNKFVSPTTAGTDDSARLGILVALMLFTSASAMEKMLIAYAKQSSAKQAIENELVKNTNAYKEGNIVYLDSNYWYLSGGGLVSVAEMVKEIDAGIK